MKSVLLTVAAAGILLASSSTATSTPISAAVKKQYVDDEGGVSLAPNSVIARVNKAKLAKIDAIKEAPRSKRSAALRRAAATCTDGSVTLDLGAGPETFPCNAIDFESFLPFETFDLPNPCVEDDSCFTTSVVTNGTTNMADNWGWLSPEGREITIQCTSNAVWFVDGTDPTDPLVLGYLFTIRPLSPWCDVKVFNDILYVSRDSFGDYYDSFHVGLQVFDLNNLVCASAYDSGVAEEFVHQAVYREFGFSGNLAVDPPTGFLYAVGLEPGGYCPGIQVIDVADPLDPQFVTCITQGDYTLDITCVTYDGPVAERVGHEVCVAFHDGAIAMYDVTDKALVEILGVVVGQASQGWFSDDFTKVFASGAGPYGGDAPEAGLLVINITDLNKPAVVDIITVGELSSESNVILGGMAHKRGLAGNAALANPPDVTLAYYALYSDGVAVVNTTSGEIIGNFDIAPNSTGLNPANPSLATGAWGTYLHPSGTLAVSSVEGGLFFLKATMAYGSDPAPVPVITPVVECPTKYPTAAPTAPTTHSPTTDCHDNIPSQLVYTSNGQEAPCFEILTSCGANIVANNCRLSCDRCDLTDSPTYGFHTFVPTPAPVPTPLPTYGDHDLTPTLPYGCVDQPVTGLYFPDGTLAMCYELAGYCANHRVVRDRCSGVCGTCDKTTDKVTLGGNPEQLLVGEGSGSGGSTSSGEKNYMLMLVVIVTAAATVLLCLGIFTAMMQAKALYK